MKKHQHRFTKSGKGEAYQTARDTTEQLGDDELWEWGTHTYGIVKADVMQAHPDLPRQDVEHVAAKALRVERGVRRKAGR